MATMMMEEGMPAETAEGTYSYMGEDYGTLDSHILGATAKPRLTQEERLANNVARRRQADLERRQRIFDAKRRTIGVDKDALDAQVAEKAEQRAYEKARDRAADREHLRIAQQTKMLEQDRQRAKRQMEQECKEFSLQNLNFQSRKEYALNDPHAVRKGTPPRIGDEDPRLGPASMQQFGGEDLMREERLRQQKAAQVNFIEQQKYEKAMMANLDKGEDKRFADQVAEITSLRNDIEASEASLRRELQRNQHAENVNQAIQDQYFRMQEAERNAAANHAELTFHATDHFLNETGVQHHGTRVLRDAYKGSTRSDREQVAAVQRDMLAEQNYQKAMAKQADNAFMGQVEMTRKQLVAMEREKQRQRRHLAEQMAQENLAGARSQKEKLSKLDQLYTNEFKPEFFEQFGTGCR
mmetsp:Transcript_135843/g.249356  ORF Transcript_135843/g.249356 Transcript_135843/m.249356 type:complete len:411 (-) Transcript_135843:105-1337(-)